MPKYTSSAVSKLRITLSEELGALYCPGAEVRGVLAFSSDRPLRYRCVSVQLVAGASGVNEEHPVTDRFAHYVTHFIGNDILIESDGGRWESHGIAVPTEIRSVAADESQPVVGQVVGTPSSHELPAGEHAFPFTFTIPRNAAGSGSSAFFRAFCTLTGTVAAAESWSVMRTTLDVLVASIVPRLQVCVDDAAVDEKAVVPLGGVVATNGAAEVKYSVSHRCLCRQDPRPFIISIAVDNVGGTQPIQAVTVRLMQYFEMDLSRRGCFCTRTVVVLGESKLCIDGDCIPARARGSAGGHLALDPTKLRINLLPTLTTKRLRVRHVLQLDLKGGKDPINVPIAAFYFIDETDQAPWWHHEKELPALHPQQWYEVQPSPSLGH